MADAKQCDRCKNFYIRNIALKTNGRISGSYIGGMAMATPDGDCDIWYDLCDSCVRDLHEFLNNYKSEQED